MTDYEEGESLCNSNNTSAMLVTKIDSVTF